MFEHSNKTSLLVLSHDAIFFEYFIKQHLEFLSSFILDPNLEVKELKGIVRF